MEFKASTKFNRYDKCYTLLENKVHLVQALDIEVRITYNKQDKEPKVEIVYSIFALGIVNCWVEEKLLFKTKEDLLKSL